MLIGITGHKRHGKDTAGNVLINEYSFIRYSFANPLKKGVKEFFGFTDEQVFDDAKDEIDERYGVTPRDLLKIFGTEIMQYTIYNFIPELINKIPPREFWTTQFRQWYIEHLKFGKSLNVVITDVRFKHEAKVIKDLGGYILKVYRPAFDEGEYEHPSEKEVDEIEEDYLITSKEDIEEFRDRVREFYQTLGRLKNGI